ncbi:MAG: flagellar motor protein MotB [Verrucomicrobiia bacterium]|jgi:chemotaxis protein MotB
MAKKQHSHGGAWKVAYADFVTGMMALFIVLWLTSQDQKIKEAVARSFKHPFMPVMKESTGLIPSRQIQAEKNTSGKFDSASAVELNVLRRLNEELLKSLKEQSEMNEDESIKLELTPEGLLISVFDKARRPIFEPDSAVFTKYGDWVFSTLGWQISRYTNFTIELEGHTEKGHPVTREDYTNWELTADRANAARRKLLIHGVKPEQIRKVAGYADTKPMAQIPPEHENQRRVSVMLKVAQK